MEISDISQVFASLAGMTPEEALEQIGLIRLAKEEIERAVRPGADLKKGRAALCYAAAANAFYRYCALSSNTGGIRSVRTGEISVDADAGTALEAAAAIRDEFMLLAAPYLLDRKFVFQAV